MNILKKIIEDKKEEVKNDKRVINLESLRKLSKKKNFIFSKQLNQFSSNNKTAIVAEIKKASPSKGILIDDFDHNKIASEYIKGGAACLSILTEKKYFLGSKQYVKDIKKNFNIPVLNKDFLFLQIAIGVSLYAIGQKLGVGGWALVLWGIPLRLVVVYHVTWLVNSATHCWGKAPFESGDSSKNNAWVAALTFGEGWHNNHHAFPNSAKQGLFKGQIDITWEHIKILAKFGFAKKVKLPSRSYY